MSFPPLTDKQLMVLKIIASGCEGIDDIRIAARLILETEIDYSQAKASLPALLGSLRKLGLIKREAAGVKNLNYGIWSLTDYGKKVLGIGHD